MTWAINSNATMRCVLKEFTISMLKIEIASLTNGSILHKKFSLTRRDSNVTFSIENVSFFDTGIYFLNAEFVVINTTEVINVAGRLDVVLGKHDNLIQ